MSDNDLQALHDHLEATGERPVETTASRYLGEAEAVVADALRPGTSPSVVETRVQQARELLAHVDSTGDDRADNHVAAARELCNRILED